ncbi:MAG: diguanylate cyclase [Bacillota bacterium]
MYQKHWDESICGLIVLDHSGIIVDCNQALLSLVGYSKEALIHQHFEILLNKAGRFFFYSLIYPSLRVEGFVRDAYLQVISVDQEAIDCSFNAKVFEGEKVIDCAIIPITRQIAYEQELRDINRRLKVALEEKEALHVSLQKQQQELIDLNKDLTFYATRDFLTRLYNRRVFIQFLENSILSYRQSQVAFSIMLLDIDHFKFVNDHYGHSRGDEVLVHLANKMVFELPDTYISSRFGGEEFFVLMPSAGTSEAYRAAERFRRSIESDSTFFTPITVSIGIATMKDYDDCDSLLVKADKAMYKAKQSGRNKVVHDNQINNETN